MIQWEIFIPVAIASAVTGWRVIKYFTKKEICFGIMKEKVNSLDEKEKASKDVHADFDDEIVDLKRGQSELNAKVEILLVHFKLSK